ncbi:hypothetical protein AARI_16190 [Glutamicibacter arilaitensis Re117]|jgi:hypothetical protein|uniref:Uncharacterized protein n=1 Tax=Glutamicibacter arilaitensis (strain DSM 16368 / CIP 108037 / IAM 15318 / JCM 13566 / NCIMB 14258 / Re117) TaxID=861360 RepID=A0ABM9PX17_GLUAR|nr:hypothetical protein AARI_16190 [Glutamicibacter arilaitensis Re117]
MKFSIIERSAAYFIDLMEPAEREIWESNVPKGALDTELA